MGGIKMSPMYNNGLKTIETVYTYEEWLKEYNRRETKRRIRQRTKRLYYMKQFFSGFILASIGILSPAVLNDATISLIAFPLGIFLILTRERVMTF